MAKTIFVSLPVADVAKATAFYQAIGIFKNETFSNEQASAMVWSDEISFMLLEHAFYQTFTGKQIADAQDQRGPALPLVRQPRRGRCNRRGRVAAGGTEPHGPQDAGFMYARAFQDLDGHAFGPTWMDVDAMGAATR